MGCAHKRRVTEVCCSTGLGANSAVQIVAFDANDDIVPLRIVAAESAISSIEAMCRAQRRPAVGKPRGRYERILQICVGGYRLRVSGAVCSLPTNVEALPVDSSRAWHVRVGAAKSRKIGEIGCVRAGRPSEYNRYQQKPTHRNAPIKHSASLHCERSEAIQLSDSRGDRLLRYARNDELGAIIAR